MSDEPRDEQHVTVDEHFGLIPEALLYDGEMPPMARLLYICLRRHGTDPSNCYPSHQRVAELLGASKRSVAAWTRALEEAGWIDRVPRFSPEGDPTSSGYHVYTRQRAGERGVRAGQRGGVRAEERGGYALGSAPKESKGNESHIEPAAAPAAPPSATTAGDRMARLAAAAKIIGDRAAQRPGVNNPGAMSKAVARGVVADRHQDAYQLLAADPWLTAHDLAERLEPSAPTPAAGRAYVGPLPVEVVLSDEDPRWDEGVAAVRGIRSELGWDREGSDE